MGAFEASYKSLLQGVSQQIPRERLSGQVTAQENMLSDPVTNLRRRPGAQYLFSQTSAGAAMDRIAAWYTDIGGEQVHIIVNCASGTLHVKDNEFNELATFTAPYLTAPDATELRAAAVGQELFIARVGRYPAKGPGASGDYDRRGFFYVRLGAFQRSFMVRIVTAAGSWVHTYTTPTGTNPGDPALATPEYICGQLVAQINAGYPTHGVTATQAGTSAYLVGVAGAIYLTVTSESGASYVVGSGARQLRNEIDLPPVLPPAADGTIISTGLSSAPVYYMYNYAQSAWLESGDVSSPNYLNGMPVSVQRDPGTGAWSLNTSNYEGRYAGDDDTNPDPAFLESGITGLGSYQGRLVILAGNIVSLSASNNPRRFYRSSVVSLNDADAIHVGASANSSASYRWCLPFQKDLLLFSEAYQALIPSGNVAITPRTATVVLTSTYDADMTSSPVGLGRTVMYPTPRSQSFFGINEMLPSSYTDSQYTSNDATSHLPKYMGGRCRFAVSSNTANMALFAPTGERNSLIVHEYLWAGDEKVQQAWHKWTFAYDIAYAYFANDRVILLFAREGQLVGCSIDPREGNVDDDAMRRPFLDFYQFAEVTDHTVGIPEWLLDFDPDVAERIRIANAEGDLAGDAVGFRVDGDSLVTVRSFPSGTVALGTPYRSALIPTAPMVQDQNGVQISTNKLTILRYLINTLGSQEYNVLVRDTNYAGDVSSGDVGTLYWSSRELMLDHARVAAASVGVVPMRTNADTTTLLIYTEGQGELNIVGLEYVCRYNQKLRRR